MKLKLKLLGRNDLVVDRGRSFSESDVMTVEVIPGH